LSFYQLSAAAGTATTAGATGSIRPAATAIGTAVPNELTERQAKRDKALFAFVYTSGNQPVHWIG